MLKYRRENTPTVLFDIENIEENETHDTENDLKPLTTSTTSKSVSLPYDLTEIKANQFPQHNLLNWCSAVKLHLSRFMFSILP